MLKAQSHNSFALSQYYPYFFARFYQTDFADHQLKCLNITHGYKGYTQGETIVEYLYLLGCLNQPFVGDILQRVDWSYIPNELAQFINLL